MKSIFQQDIFWSPRLGQSSIDSLSPEQKQSQLDDAYTPVWDLWNKTLGVVNKNGGLGDRLKNILGDDYNTFVTGYYAVMDFEKKIDPVIAKTGSDTTLWPTITQDDFDLVSQWKSMVTPLADIVTKHTQNPAASAAPPAASSTPQGSPNTPFTPSAPAAAGFPTGLVLGGVGVVGIGVLILALS